MYLEIINRLTIQVDIYINYIKEIITQSYKDLTKQKQ